MLTVDLLHEVELGVWKALLLHLVQMLHACGANTVHEFNEQYELLNWELQAPRSTQASFRAVPPFSDKIRHFEDNVSDMKRLAGHDFEDLLQVRGLSVFGHPDVHNTSVYPSLH